MRVCATGIRWKGGSTRNDIGTFLIIVFGHFNSHVIEVQLCVKTLNVGAKDQCGTIGVSILA